MDCAFSVRSIMKALGFYTIVIIIGMQLYIFSKGNGTDSSPSAETLRINTSASRSSLVGMHITERPHTMADQNKVKIVKLIRDTGRHGKRARIHASKSEIDKYLLMYKTKCLNDWVNRTLAPGMKPRCPCVPDTLVKSTNIKFGTSSLEKIMAANKDVKPGGHWQPSTCTARYSVVIIIPFRDRMAHLSVLLRHLHPVLRGQQLNYTIIVIEQNEPALFNKAALMNVGYIYAKEYHNPDCIIFHDVDVIPEDGRHFYTCLKSGALHFGAYNSRHKYKIKYHHIFGAVTSFSPKIFEKVNGFSNRFSGWGGEDDDMGMRLVKKHIKLIRDPRAVSGFTILKHARDKGNRQPNYKRMKQILRTDRNSKYDGLNTIRFMPEKLRHYPLYTWLLVDILNGAKNIGFAIN